MNALAPLPVVIPLGTAAAVLAVSGLDLRRLVRVLTVGATLAEIGVAAALVHQTRMTSAVYWFGGWTPRHGLAIGISFTIDPLGAGAAVLAGVTTLVALTATSSMRDASGIVHALFLALLAAMAGFCLTGDLFNMFVFFELMAVSAFGLVAYQTQDLGSLRGALNFAITNSIGAFLVLIGIALLYARTGALNLAQIGHSVASGHVPAHLLTIALALIVVGFLIKAAVMPFHFWLIDTVATAPLSVVIVLAGVLDSLGIYGIARVYWTMFSQVPAEHRALQTILVCVGGGTCTLAASLSLAFRDPRRRLGFIMVAHTGISLTAIGCLSSLGVAGAAIYVVADGTVKIALVLAMAIDGGGEDSPRWSPRVVVMSLVGLALAGFPLFGTGLGKAVIEDALSRAGFPLVAGLVVVGSALTGAAVLGMAWESRAGRREGDARPGPAGLAIALLGSSALMTWVGPAVGRYAARFSDAVAYGHQVLSLPATRPEPPLPRVALTGVGIAIALVTVAAAVGLAIWRSLSRVSRPTGRVAARALSAARRAHDGSIGDSATWVTIGTATIAFVLAAAGR